MDVKQLPCASCKYPGFNGLVYSCRHPQHPGPIGGKRVLQILQNGGSCANRIDVDKKVMLGDPIPWPQPISFAKE